MGLEVRVCVANAGNVQLLLVPAGTGGAGCGTVALELDEWNVNKRGKVDVLWGEGEVSSCLLLSFVVTYAKNTYAHIVSLPLSRILLTIL